METASPWQQRKGYEGSKGLAYRKSCRPEALMATGLIAAWNKADIDNLILI